MERQRKHILFIIPEMIVGGAQRSLSKISLELSRHHDVSVVIFNRNLPLAYPCGGELYSLDVEAGSGTAGKIRALLLRVRRLRALKKRLKIDLSVSFLEGADYINVLSRTNDKIILSVRGSKLHDETMKKKYSGWRTGILIPWLYRKADHIVAVNKGIEEEIRHYFRIAVPVTVIYNFYSADDISKLAEIPRDDFFDKIYQSPVLVTTGRLAPEKGLDFLLNVFSRLRKQTDVTLVIVGDGPEYERLNILARELDLSIKDKSGQQTDADVIFTGNQENVYPFLKNAALYLLASSSEGFPNSMVEAMFCGVPVIAADCPYGPREILARETGTKELSECERAAYGILMPQPSMDGRIMQIWTAVISKTLSDHALRQTYALAGKRRASEFSTDAAIGKWLDIIDSLAAS